MSPAAFAFQGTVSQGTHTPCRGHTGDTHMSQDTQQDHISKKRVLYTMPGVDAVSVRRDVEYQVTDAGALTMDLYYPPDSKSGARTPAVIFVTGFSDVGARKMLGCTQKEMGSYISWGQLAAASGLVAANCPHEMYDPISWGQ